MLLRQPFLRFFQEGDLLVYEITVIDDAATARADEVVMMILSLGPLGQLETSPSVTEIKLVNETNVYEHVQRSINRGQTNGGVGLMDTYINIFGAEVILSPGQDVQYRITPQSQAEAESLDPASAPVMSSFELFFHDFTFVIENHFQ